MRHSFFIITFSTLSAIALMSCNSIDNSVNEVGYLCNIPADEVADPSDYVKFVSQSERADPTKFEAFSLNSGQLIPVTNGNCISVSALDSVGPIVVRNPAFNEGTLFNPETVNSASSKQGIVSIWPLETNRYQAIPSQCTTQVFPSSWKVDLRSFIEVPMATYLATYSVKSSTESELELRNFVVTPDQPSINIDARKYREGKYNITIMLKELYSAPETEYRVECELIIDRTASQVALDFGDRQVFPVKEKTVYAFNPGEFVRFIVDDTVSQSTVYFCKNSLNSEEPNCEFLPLQDRTFIVPDAGKWSIRFFTKDGAGNKSQTEEFTLVSYNQASIEEVKAIASSATILRKARNYLEALAQSVLAFRKFLALPTSIEKSVVEDLIDQVLFANASGTLPIYENDAIGAFSFAFWLDDERFVEQNFLDNKSRIRVTQIGNIEEPKELNLQDLGLMGSKYRPMKCGNQGQFFLIKGVGEIIRFDTFSNQVRTISLSNERFNVIRSDNACDLIVLNKWVNNERSTLLLSFELEDEVGRNEDLTQFYPVNDGKTTRVYQFDEESGLVFDIANSNEHLFHDVKAGFSAQHCPDLVAFWGSGGVITVFDANLQELASIGDFSENLRFSKTCKVVAYVSQDGILRVISLESGQQIGQRWVGLGNLAALGVGGKKIALIRNADPDRIQVFVLDGTDRERIYKTEAGFQDLVFNSADQLFAYGSFKQYIFDLDLRLVNIHSNFPGYSQGFIQSTDGSFIYRYSEHSPTRSGSFEIKEYLARIDVSSGSNKITKLTRFERYDRTIHQERGPYSLLAEYTGKDGVSRLATAILDNSVRIFEGQSLEKFNDYHISEPSITAISFANNGDWLIIGNKQGQIFLLTREGHAYLIHTLAQCSPPLSQGVYPIALQIEYLNNNDQLLISDSCGRIHSYNVFTTVLAELIKVGSYEIQGLEPTHRIQANSSFTRFTVSNALIASSGSGGSVKIWNLDLTLEDEFHLKAQNSSNRYGVALSFDRRRENLYIGMPDGSWNRYNLSSSSLLKVDFAQVGYGPMYIAAADEINGLVASDGKSILMWNLNKEQFVKNACVFLKDKQSLVRNVNISEACVNH